MIYAIARLNKRQSEAIQQIFNLQSSIFNSGLSGLGLDLPTMAENKLYVKSIMSTIYGVF